MTNRSTRAWLCVAAITCCALFAPREFGAIAAPKTPVVGASRDGLFERIVSSCGYGAEVRLWRGPVYAAQAVLIDDQQVILYNPKVLDRLEREAGTSWAAASVLAHELGHHYYGHPHLAHRSVSSELRHRCELAADYFSGYALARLGATLGEAQAAQRLLMTAETDLHPASSMRLVAIESGWLDATAGHPIAAAPDAQRVGLEKPAHGAE